MRKTIIIFVICFAFSVVNASAQKTKPKTVPKSVVQTKIDLGKLNGNTYTNDTFAFKIEFPYGWLVGDNTLEAQLKEIAQGQIKARNPNNQQSVNKAIDKVTPLLGGYKSLPGTPDNPNLRIMAEDLSAQPEIKTGKDYLNLMSVVIKTTKFPDDFKYSGVKSETIDNSPLDYIETSTGNIKKRMYVTVRKSFAILIAIEYYQESEFDDLHKILTEMSLSYKK